MVTDTPQPSLGALLWADLQSFAELKGTRLGSVGSILDVLFFPGVLSVLLFRLSTLFHRAGLRPVSRILYILNEMLFGADLAPGARIGPGFAMPHPVGVIIGADVRMGAKARVFRGVQIGGAAYEDRSRDGMPVIGDNCWISERVKVLGPIEVGSDAILTASALVLQSVPAGGIVAGIPARFQRFREGYGPSAMTPPPDAGPAVVPGSQTA